MIMSNEGEVQDVYNVTPKEDMAPSKEKKDFDDVESPPSSEKEAEFSTHDDDNEATKDPKRETIERKYPDESSPHSNELTEGNFPPSSEETFDDVENQPKKKPSDDRVDYTPEIQVDKTKIRSEEDVEPGKSVKSVGSKKNYNRQFSKKLDVVKEEEEEDKQPEEQIKTAMGEQNNIASLNMEKKHIIIQRLIQTKTTAVIMAPR